MIEFNIAILQTWWKFGSGFEVFNLGPNSHETVVHLTSFYGYKFALVKLALSFCHILNLQWKSDHSHL